MQGCGLTPPPCQLEKIVSCGYGATRRGQELAGPRARLIGANTNTGSGSYALGRAGAGIGRLRIFASAFLLN